MNNIEILYEDADILAINKPAGLIVHGDGRIVEPSVEEWFMSKYPEARGVGEDPIDGDEYQIERWGIVHRIDRETSGVLLLAKTKEGHAHLKEQFQNREIQKKYSVFIHGILKEKHGSINLPIGKSPSDFRKWSASRGARGEMREALTYYQVLAEKDGISLVEAQPKTGRTHQIRVHFAALQKPVVADSLYGKPGAETFNFSRLALHARTVTFRDLAGVEQSVTAPYPEDFKEALDTIGYSVLD